MDPRLQKAIQRDEQEEASLSQAIGTVVEGFLTDTHTCLPGIVRSFDAAAQTARVQPAIKRIFAEAGAVNLPECLDVPVHFPAGGNYVLTFPVAAGDECLLVFSERAIDFWWDKGGVQLPAEYRMHDLSDAFAIVGVFSKPRKIPKVSTDGVELRTKDGSTVVRIDSAGVTLGAVAGAQGVPLGDNLKTYLATIATAINGLAPGAVLPPDAATPPLLSTKVKVSA